MMVPNLPLRTVFLPTTLEVQTTDLEEPLPALAVLHGQVATPIFIFITVIFKITGEAILVTVMVVPFTQIMLPLPLITVIFSTMKQQPIFMDMVVPSIAKKELPLLPIV